MSDYYYKKIEDGLIDAPEDTPELLEEQQQIWGYIPLVRKIAVHLASHCNLSYLDLCQQGYYILAELTLKVDWLDDRRRISSYVKRSLEGLMKNYVGKYNGVISLPKWNADYYKFNVETIGLDETDELAGAELNPEESYVKKETEGALRAAVVCITPTLNEREYYILLHCMLVDEPMGYREVAAQFDVSRESIRRDVNRIRGKLKEIMNEYFKA